MKIEELRNRQIKLSPHSITVKENDKTCGVVRGVQKFLDLRPNIQMNYSKILRDSGIWGNKERLIDNVYYCDGKLYYFYNLKKDEDYKRYFSAPGWDTEHKNYDERQSIAKRAEECGIIVIPAYFL